MILFSSIESHVLKVLGQVDGTFVLTIRVHLQLLRFIGLKWKCKRSHQEHC